MIILPCNQGLSSRCTIASFFVPWFNSSELEIPTQLYTSKFELCILYVVQAVTASSAASCGFTSSNIL